MRQGRSTYVFPGSNTALGFQSFYRQGLQGLEHIYILKGSPGCGKSTLMRKIGSAMLERGYDVEFWQCSADNDSLDGVIVKGLSAAVIDGTAPHTVDPVYPGVVDEIINLGEHWSSQSLRRQKQSILHLYESLQQAYAAAQEDLSAIGEITAEACRREEKRLDSQKLNDKIHQLLDELFVPTGAVCRHLFASAVTPRGLISLADALTRVYPRRYILNGPPGCGKEKILQAVADAAAEKGLAAQVYHSALQPQHIEAVVLPELGTALADLFLCSRESQPGDVVIDCTELSHEKTDDGETLAFKQKLNDLADKAAGKLSEAKLIHDKLESCYSQAMDYEAVDLAGKRLFNRLLTLAAEQENRP
ncbi:MAG: hypothetical protein K6B40_02765 [Firmicutes bacterium]|nr:hypothetical protein [Bacillota bacterium]